jgi:hypothetical protein
VWCFAPGVSPLALLFCPVGACDGCGVSLQGFHPWLCCFAPLGHAIHTPYRGGDVLMRHPRGFPPLASLFSPLRHAIHTPYRGGDVRMGHPRGFTLALLFSPLEHAIHTPQRGNTTKPRVKPWEMPPNQSHRPVGAGQGADGCQRCCGVWSRQNEQSGQQRSGYTARCSLLYQTAPQSQ